MGGYSNFLERMQLPIESKTRVDVSKNPKAPKEVAQCTKLEDKVNNSQFHQFNMTMSTNMSTDEGH